MGLFDVTVRSPIRNSPGFTNLMTLVDLVVSVITCPMENMFSASINMAFSLGKGRLSGGKTVRDFDGDAHEPHLRATLLLTHHNLRLGVVSGLKPQVRPDLSVAVDHGASRGRILQTSVATDHGGNQGIVLP